MIHPIADRSGRYGFDLESWRNILFIMGRLVINLRLQVTLSRSSALIRIKFGHLEDASRSGSANAQRGRCRATFFLSQKVNKVGLFNYCLWRIR
jgi:hypothetical protein